MHTKQQTVTALQSILDDESLRPILKANGMINAITSASYHLTPKFTTKSKKPEAWVCSPVEKKSIRTYLKHAYVDDKKRLIGCDGHRLHLMNDCNLSTGYYCSKTLVPVENDSQYPDIDRVIPASKRDYVILSHDFIRSLLDKVSDKSDRKSIMKESVVVNGEEQPFCYNAYYLNDLLRIPSKNFTIKYIVDTKVVTVESDCGKYYGLLMPCIY